jgi:GTP cyclohydrolase I
MAVDREKIEEHIRGILEAIGENPDREGLKETPSRVARMYEEIFEGIGYSNEEIAQMYNKTFEEDLIVPEGNKDMVIIKNIEIFSYCEHHLALMYNMKLSIAYIPNGKIIGLSKIARIAEMVGKRLQLQERIGSDIAEIMQMVTGTEDTAVIIEGQHACMTARGVKNTAAVTVTTTLRGRFNTDENLAGKLLII